MGKVIQDEFDYFLAQLKDEKFEIGRYLYESDYEDEYSQDEIYNAMSVLKEKICKELRKNHKGKYLVSGGWCIFVMTPERARKSNLSERAIVDYLVT